MAQKFDAYYKWFGIRPEEQPPNHYRLLGVQPFEQDPDVISNAADQRMSHLRSLQNGPYAYESQRILNEVSRARVTLLDVEQKLEYDVVLRKKVAAAAKAEASRTSALPQSPDIDLLDDLPGAGNLDFDSFVPQAAAPGNSASRPGGGYAVYRRKSSGVLLKFVSLLIGGCLGLSLVYVMLAKFGRIDPLELFPKVDVAEGGDDTNGAGKGNAPVVDPAKANQRTPDKADPGEGESSGSRRNGTTGNQRNRDASAEINSKAHIDKKPPPVDPAAADVSPFEGLPQFVALGPVAEKSPQTLAQIGGPPDAPKQLSMNFEAADLDKGKKLELVAQNAKDMPRWRIELVSVDATKNEKRESLAELWIDGSTLFFAWDAAPERAAEAAQLQNSLIALRSGKHEAELRLRSPVVLPVHVLELATAANLVEIPVEAIPKAESLILELGQPDTLAWNSEFPEHKNNVRFVTPTREKIILALDTITEQDRPELVIEPQATPKGLSFRTSMRVVNRDKETPVSSAYVTETKKKYTALKIKTDRDWTTLRNKISALEASAKDLGRELRLNPAQRGRIERELARVNAQIFQNNAAFKKIEASKAEYDGVLDFLPAIEGLVQDLHKKAKIPYRVYAKAGDAEIEIVRAMEPMVDPALDPTLEPTP